MNAETRVIARAAADRFDLLEAERVAFEKLAVELRNSADGSVGISIREHRGFSYDWAHRGLGLYLERTLKRWLDQQISDRILALREAQEDIRLPD